MVFHSRRKLCSSENLKTSNSFVDFRLRAVRASLGHGLSLFQKQKTLLSESSDMWDCHYRSSHRRAFAFPANLYGGTKAKLQSQESSALRLQSTIVIVVIYKLFSLCAVHGIPAKCISVAVRQLLSELYCAVYGYCIEIIKL